MGLCIRTNSTHGYVQEAQLRGEVERGVALVCEVWVLEVLGVVLDDALEEGEVLETDGSADADGDVNPLGFLVRAGFGEVQMADSHGSLGLMHWTRKAVLADEHGGDRWITRRQCEGYYSAEIVGRKNLLPLGSFI